MLPPHLAHSTASSHVLKSAVWPGGAGSSAAGGLRLARRIRGGETRLHLGGQDARLLLLVGRQELLAHPAEDVVDDRLRDADVGVVRHPRRLEAHVAELRDVHLERHAVLEAERDGDHERVHQAGEGRALLRDVDEDVARRAVVEQADVDVALVLADLELAAHLDAIVRGPVAAFGAA